MLIFLSDLHLTDTSERSTIDSSRLVVCLREVLDRHRNKGVRDIKIVLLGDIFELLKSKKWHEQKVRPWDAPTKKHPATVTAIFNDIIRCNLPFFEGLAGLSTGNPAPSLMYIPGNHDWVLNAPMGKEARKLLEAKLPLLATGKESFEQNLVDDKHGVVATHGHGWDPANRHSSGKGQIGDAVVIDLIVRLPMLVSQQLQLPENDDSLEFLHEIDNVSPQVPKTMAEWLIAGLDGIKDSHPGAGEALERSFRCLITEFKVLLKQTEFESIKIGNWWISLFSGLARKVVKSFGGLRAARLIPKGGEGPDPYVEGARRLIETAMKSSPQTNYRYVVFGHTHGPEVIPLQVRTRHGSQCAIYLNTGTWRRAHLVASGWTGAGAPRLFECRDEESLLCLYSQEEQAFGFPAYEFSRVTRGRFS